MDLRAIIRDGPIVRTAGGLVWREEGGREVLAIVRRRRHQDWVLPKGKLKRGESFSDAAVREVSEETGCQPRLGAYAGHALYACRRGAKVVLYWHMTPGGGAFSPSDEIDDIAWVEPERAIELLSNPAEKRVLRKAVAARRA
jgi:8-oxo-dGTP diphosphatase